MIVSGWPKWRIIWLRTEALSVPQGKDEPLSRDLAGTLTGKMRGKTIDPESLSHVFSVHYENYTTVLRTVVVSKVDKTSESPRFAPSVIFTKSFNA